MTISDLNGKNVCIIGYAREGRAAHRALLQFAPKATITICDMSEDTQLEGPGNLHSGKDYLRGLDQFDVIIKSSGVPRLPELEPHESRITNAASLFFATIASSGVRTVGITGTKGKSTTSSLIYHALKAAFPRTFLMGNIGIPMLDFLPEAKADTIFVIELSSYMLEGLTHSPNVAVITSFFPEHLDRHGSAQAYWDAKSAITRYQRKTDAVFYCADYPECKAMAKLSPGQKFGFTGADYPGDLAATQLKGEHNRSNLAAAYNVAQFFGVPSDAAIKALEQTPSLPSRLQSLGVIDGIEWVDDALSTAPQATMFAIDALGNNVDTLITGGMDRGLDFTELARHLSASNISNLVLFPDSGEKIKAALTRKFHILETSSMKEAVDFARAHTKKGATCLLSSAAPSYNLFKNYEDKAAQFAAAIHSSRQ